MADDIEAAARAAGLTLSGPITVTTPGAVIENLHIRATGETPGIIVSGADDVIIRNVLVEHEAASGISVDDSNGVTIDTVEVRNTIAPDSGPHDGLYVNIDLFRSADVGLTNVRVAHGSTGLLAIEAPGLTVDGFDAFDQRGPFPRGQGVQLDSSNGAVIENFHIVNDPASAWTEDNISVIDSSNVVIRNGIIDGNNAPSGVGVLVETYDDAPAAGVAVENVQVFGFYNGAFSAANGATDVAFTDVYAEGGLTPEAMSAAAGANFRGPPLSGQEAFHAYLAADSIIFADAAYFDIPTVASYFSDPEVVTADGFTEARQAPDATGFVVSMPWDLPDDAAGRTIIIDAAADLFDGAPVMRVAQNGQVLFEGAVTAASDAGALQRIEITTEAPLDPDAALEISFLNDAYDGEGFDRNLLIDRVEIDGRAVLLDQLTPPEGAAYDDGLIFLTETTLAIDIDDDGLFEPLAVGSLAEAPLTAEAAPGPDAAPGLIAPDGFDLL